MLNLSEVMIQNPDLENFDALKAFITERALAGAIHFRIDVKPTYPDTPEDWEDQLEIAFYEPNKI